MVLNSIFIYSKSGHTLAMRDYNPGESTIPVSNTFVTKHLKAASTSDDQVSTEYSAKWQSDFSQAGATR